MNTTILTEQINHYAKLLKKLKEIQSEANFIRDKIARKLIDNDTNKFYCATLVKVKKHWVKKHERGSSSYLKISKSRNISYE